MRKNTYINGRQGKLECILFEPDERNAGKGSFLFLPGVPGTDKNEDLAEMLCFDGYRVLCLMLCFDGYRVLCLSFSGTCGSEGIYSLEHALEDAETAYGYLSALDPDGVSVFGHSMGGFIAAHTAASHPNTSSLILMFPCDIGRLPIWDDESIMTSYIVKDFLDSHASLLSGVSSEQLISEIYLNSKSFSLINLAPALSRIPVLMIGGSRDRYAPPRLNCSPLGGSRDRYAPPRLNCSPLYDGLRSIQGSHVVYKEFETGHYGADCRGLISIAISDFLRENVRIG